jgi:hypothetical protein
VIARRQQVARWARRLAFPVFISSVYLERFSEWFFGVGLAVVGLLIILLMRGETQRCPRCDTSLTIRRWWREELAPTCPACGCPID